MPGSDRDYASASSNCTPVHDSYRFLYTRFPTSLLLSPKIDANKAPRGGGGQRVSRDTRATCNLRGENVSPRSRPGQKLLARGFTRFFGDLFEDAARDDIAIHFAFSRRETVDTRARDNFTLEMRIYNRGIEKGRDAFSYVRRASRPKSRGRSIPTSSRRRAFADLSVHEGVYPPPRMDRSALARFTKRARE